MSRWDSAPHPSRPPLFRLLERHRVEHDLAFADVLRGGVVGSGLIHLAFLPLDLLCVPGGPGVNELLTDADLLAFLRRAASRAKYVTSVCSGSLVLGAAGLLRRRRAGSHWMSREMLRSFGAEPVDARTVVDGNVITGGGVTAGIDLALQVVAEIAGRDAAEAIQLAIEYDPRPPFDAGSPSRARQDLVRRVARAAEPMLRERAEQVRRAAAALDEAAPPR